MAVKKIIKKSAKKAGAIRIRPVAGKKGGSSAKSGMAPAARITVSKKPSGFDADAEFGKVAPTLVVFGGLVFDEYLAELGAAGLNCITDYKVELEKISQGTGSISKLAKIREKIWQAFAIGNAYVALIGYNGNGAAALRGALVSGWEKTKANFYEKGVEDAKLLEIAADVRVLGRPPNDSWEAVADSIAKRHGLEGAGG